MIGKTVIFYEVVKMVGKTEFSSNEAIKMTGKKELSSANEVVKIIGKTKLSSSNVGNFFNPFEMFIRRFKHDLNYLMHVNCLPFLNIFLERTKLLVTVFLLPFSSTSA